MVSDLQETPAIEEYYDMPEEGTYNKTSGGGEEPIGEYPSERLMYYYHPDYLGNVEYITDMDGLPYQYFSYTPWGEEFKSDIVYPNSWDSPYRFNGKEIDEETGLYYYGARYYNPSISVWLSVDPLAYKYPSSSAYVFAGNNPVVLIDPNGKEVWIVGDEESAQKAAEELNNSSSLNITRDENGKLHATGEAKTDADKLLLAAIKSKKHDVRISALDGDSFKLGDFRGNLTGGAFMGSVSKGENDRPMAIQLINVSHFENQEENGGNETGVSITHELIEAYLGVSEGKIGLRTKAAKLGREGEFDNDYFKPAHEAAMIADPRFVEPKHGSNPNNPWQIELKGKQIDIRTGKEVKN